MTLAVTVPTSPFLARQVHRRGTDCPAATRYGSTSVVWPYCAEPASQRGYFGSDRAVNCKTSADTGLTVLSGPLNYAGVNPTVHCGAHAPHPSA